MSNVTLSAVSPVRLLTWQPHCFLFHSSSFTARQKRTEISPKHLSIKYAEINMKINTNWLTLFWLRSAHRLGIIFYLVDKCCLWKVTRLVRLWRLNQNSEVARHKNQRDSGTIKHTVKHFINSLSDNNCKEEFFTQLFSSLQGVNIILIVQV